MRPVEDPFNRDIDLLDLTPLLELSAISDTEPQDWYKIGCEEFVKIMIGNQKHCGIRTILEITKGATWLHERFCTRTPGHTGPHVSGIVSRKYSLIWF